MILREVPRIIRFMEMESGAVIPGTGRGGNGGLLLNGYRVSVWDEKNVLEVDGTVV